MLGVIANHITLSRHQAMRGEYLVPLPSILPSFAISEPPAEPSPQIVAVYTPHHIFENGDVEYSFVGVKVLYGAQKRKIDEACKCDKPEDKPVKIGLICQVCGGIRDTNGRNYRCEFLSEHLEV